MVDSVTSDLLKLRLLVGFLGERAQFGWWPTAFFESSSRRFLEPAFTKTTALAQYHGVLEAARQLHDEHLSTGSYHLFRLPEEMEQDLHAVMHSAVGDQLVANALRTKEAALGDLQSMAAPNTKRHAGPVSVGSFAKLRSPDVARARAGAYSSAFSHSYKSYPYVAV